MTKLRQGSVVVPWSDRETVTVRHSRMGNHTVELTISGGAVAWITPSQAREIGEALIAYATDADSGAAP